MTMALHTSRGGSGSFFRGGRGLATATYLCAMQGCRVVATQADANKTRKKAIMAEDTSTFVSISMRSGS